MTEGLSAGRDRDAGVMQRRPPPESHEGVGNLHLRNITSSVRRAIPIAAVVLLAASTAGAQQYVMTRPGTTQAVAVQPTTYVTQPAAQPVTYAAQPAATQAVVSGDPYGFVGWLNATRAQYGLRAVGYDPNLSDLGGSEQRPAECSGDGPSRDGPGPPPELRNG